jgi:hypothetical protein
VTGLTGLDWVVAGAAAVSLYELASMWLTSRRVAPAAVDAED